MDNDLFLGFILDRYEATELVEILNASTSDLVDRFYEEILDNPTLWNDYTNDPRYEQDSRETETSDPAKESYRTGLGDA